MMMKWIISILTMS
ncbi:Type-I membrane glycoprotein, partial [Monkeypox virus]